MKAISLFSGSTGNCTLLEVGGRCLLIDAGGSAKAIGEALAVFGYSLHDVTDIFITHEHGDHTHGLAVLTKKHPIPVHITERSAKCLSVKDGMPLKDCLVIHPDEFCYDLGNGAQIEAFAAPHDSAHCVGYRISDGDGTVGIVTDLGYVTQRVYDRLIGCDAVILEANHDKEMVRCGSYAPSLKQRILSGGGHLSNDDCAEVAAALARKGTRTFMLAHLSCENNTEEAARAAVGEALSPYGVTLLIAKPDEPTVLC